MGKVAKIFIVLILTLAAFFTYGIVGQAEKTTQLYYDGAWHDYNAQSISLKISGKIISTLMPPIIFGETSLVPAREVFETLGAKVEWFDAQRIVKVTGNDINISLKIDSKIALVNGANKPLEVPAKIVNEKTMIPIRFVSEQLGFKVNWSDAERIIDISRNQADANITDIIFVDSNQSSGTTNVSTGTKTVQVDIKGDRPLDKYTTMTLTGPERLVIDIQNSVLAVNNKNVSVAKYGIDQIRSAQYTTEPNNTRIVLDMQKPISYEILKSNDNNHLLINLLVSTTYINTVATQPTPKDKYVVVIDPGHGGYDPGAVYSGITEKELNLNIGLKLKNLLLNDNIDVEMTREDDTFVDLYPRTDFANKVGADLFLSIHNNALEDKSFDGTMTLYYPNDDVNFTNKRFAEIIQKEITSQAGTTDRGLRERPHLAVLRTSYNYKIPAVLVEAAFMTNKKDCDNLKSDEFQEKVAKALRDGIIKALDEKRSSSI